MIFPVQGAIADASNYGFGTDIHVQSSLKGKLVPRGGCITRPRFELSVSLPHLMQNMVQLYYETKLITDLRYQ